MKPTHIAALLVLVVAVPAAAAGSLFSSNAKPCFIAGASGYQISASASADVTARIVSTTAKPSLRMQLVDDSSAADFVLVDDSDTVNACTDAAAVQSIRIDPNARNADLTVVLSRQPADYKIYVRSANLLATGRRRAVCGDLESRRQDPAPGANSPRVTDVYHSALNAPFTTFARARKARAAGNRIARFRAPNAAKSVGFRRRHHGIGVTGLSHATGTPARAQQGGAGAVRPRRRVHHGGGFRLARLPHRHAPASSNYDPYAYGTGVGALFAAACAFIAYMLMRQRAHAEKMRALETRIEELSDDNWELRETEERARSLLEAQGDLIVRRDAERPHHLCQ